jgi:hypothetical protein
MPWENGTGADRERLAVRPGAWLWECPQGKIVSLEGKTCSHSFAKKSTVESEGCGRSFGKGRGFFCKSLITKAYLKTIIELSRWAFELQWEVYLSNSLRSDRVLGMGEEAQSCGFNF